MARLLRCFGLHSVRSREAQEGCQHLIVLPASGMHQFCLGAVPASRQYPFVDLVWDWTLFSSSVPEGTTCMFWGKIIIKCLAGEAAECLTATPESSIHC